MHPILTPAIPPIREALYTLAMAATPPDAQVLDEVVRQYPQFADALTDFAVELALDFLKEAASDATVADVDTGAVSPAVSRAVSRFHNRVYALRQAAATTVTHRALASTSAVNPFAHLSREDFRAVARAIGATTVFVAKLRDRQIDPDTMPYRFKRLVSHEVNVPVDVLSAHLGATGDPAGTRGQFYKAPEKPTHNQRQSFADAVKNSGLTAEQQRRLLSL